MTRMISRCSNGRYHDYLAEKLGCFLPADPEGRSRVIQWATWQVSGLGPRWGR